MVFVMAMSKMLECVLSPGPMASPNPAAMMVAAVPCNAQILLQLVIGALQERGRHLIHGLAARLGDAGDRRHRMLFGDADVHELVARLLTLLRAEPAVARRASGQHHHAPVPLHLVQQVVAGHTRVILRRSGLYHGVLHGLWQHPVPGFLRLARGVHSLQAMSLVGVDVHDDWMVDVLDFDERVDQRVDIVAVLHIPVVESEGTEQVVLGCAVGGAQFGEPLVNAAVDSERWTSRCR